MRDPDSFIQDKIREIQDIVKDGKVVVALSGGVDSTVAAVLCSRAIRDNLICFHVDTGLMRKNESETVVESLKKLGLKIDLINAQERFYEALKGITEPEKKRKIIGELFIRLFEEEAEKIGDFQFLVQGTLAPDWIESGQGVGGKTDTIKSHHNVGGLPEDINFELLEPLRDLYKDEVRLIAQKLDVPKELYEKQPFPGPGLGIRIVGEVTADSVRIVQEADAIVREEIDKEIEQGNMERPWQYSLYYKRFIIWFKNIAGTWESVLIMIFK